jgi:hypothetical protein
MCQPPSRPRCGSRPLDAFVGFPNKEIAELFDVAVILLFILLE